MSSNQSTENNGYMKVDKKKVFLAAIGTILITAVSGFGDPFREWLIFESGYTISWINFFDKLYSAAAMALQFFIIICFGTLGAADFAKVNETVAQNNKLLNETRNASNDVQGKDSIEAEKKHMSLADYKLKKYGDANYDYGASAEEQARLQAQKAELEKQLAAINAQTAATTTPAPATTAATAPVATTATATATPTDQVKIELAKQG